VYRIKKLNKRQRPNKGLYSQREREREREKQPVIRREAPTEAPTAQSHKNCKRPWHAQNDKSADIALRNQDQNNEIVVTVSSKTLLSTEV
jgi:hypothetical protein